MPRKLERTPLIYHLRVLNKDTGKIFGYLGNITTDGILLFCPKAVKLNVTFSLDLRLPVAINGETQIPVKATSVWCQHDEKLGMYVAGFRSESTVPSGPSLIADTIAALGGQERAHQEFQAKCL